jgi:ribosomal protein S27AE
VRTAAVTCATCGHSDLEHAATSSILRNAASRWMLRDEEWFCPECREAILVADHLAPWAAWDEIEDHAT